MLLQCKNILNIFVLLVLYTTSSISHASQTNELVILTWSEYVDPDVIKSFEKEYNTKVRFVYFESDELRDDILINSDASGFDIICTNGRIISSYAKRGWISKITTQDVPNKKHIDKQWGNAFPMAEEYAIPYFWGTTGIAYRQDLVKTPITSWKQLMEPAPELQGKIIMIEDARELMAVALKSQRQSINTNDRTTIQNARNLLQQHSEYVQDYSYITLTKESSLVKGNAVAALAYSGDALTVAEIDKNIVYVVPGEGTYMWVDYFVVAKNSKNRQSALNFLNYINEPKIAAQQAQYLYYATPNMAAKKLLPEEFTNNKNLYPDQKTINSSEFLQTLPPKIQKLYNRILPQLTRK